MAFLKNIVVGVSPRTAGVGRMVGVGVLSAAGLLAIGGLTGCANQAQQDETARLTAENQQLRDQVASSGQAQSATETQLAQARAELAGRMANPNPNPQPGPGSGRSQSPDTVLEIAGDVAFSSGQAELTAAGRRELDKIASTIKARFSGNRIRVEGYTDKNPIRKSKWGSNEALSLGRAQAVEKYLSTKGISASRIEAVGLGATKLKGSDSASRRVEIVIIGG